jgi:hypothetical protein
MCFNSDADSRGPVDDGNIENKGSVKDLNIESGMQCQRIAECLRMAQERLSEAELSQTKNARGVDSDLR